VSGVNGGGWWEGDLADSTVGLMKYASDVNEPEPGGKGATLWGALAYGSRTSVGAVVKDWKSAGVEEV